MTPTEYGEVCDGCGKLLICRSCGKFRTPTPAQACAVRLEARLANNSNDWTEIFPSQLEWVAKAGHQVRAIEVAAQPPAAPVETSEREVQAYKERIKFQVEMIERRDAEIEALKRSSAESEPAAWQYFGGGEWHTFAKPTKEVLEFWTKPELEGGMGSKVRPLFTREPQRSAGNVALAQALYEAECYGIGATSDTNQRVILQAAKELAEFQQTLKNINPVKHPRPHKTMTLDEYLAEPRIKGWHNVCFDVDGFGGVGVLYHGEPQAAPVSLGLKTSPELLALIERAKTHVMSPEEKHEQRRSFMRGMCPSSRDYKEWCEAVDQLVPPLSLARPVLCPNGLEHGACLHPECVPSCPGRLSLSRPLPLRDGGDK